MSLLVNRNHFGKKLSQLDNNSIFFLLINYNNKKEIVNFIHQFDTISDKVFFGVLNNGGKKSEWLENNLLENSVVLNSEKNLGYIGGANFLLQNMNIKSRYIVLCNSDIYLNSSKLVNYLLSKEYDENISVVGPSIKSPNSSNQNPLYTKMPSKKTFKKWKFIYSSQILFRLYYLLSKIKIKSSESKKNSKFPFALHGSFMIFINNSEFTLDYFNTNIFLFGEEIHIGHIAKKKNMKLYYDSNMSIFHDEHVSTGKLSDSFRRRELLKSIVLLEKEIYTND